MRNTCKVKLICFSVDPANEMGKVGKKKQSAAEKQRAYRARRDADPTRRSEYVKKEQERYQLGKETGRKKIIANMDERSQRRQRKMWRHCQQRHRRKPTMETPPVSPDAEQPSTS